MSLRLWNDLMTPVSYNSSPPISTLSADFFEPQQLQQAQPPCFQLVKWFALSPLASAIIVSFPVFSTNSVPEQASVCQKIQCIGILSLLNQIPPSPCFFTFWNHWKRWQGLRVRLSQVSILEQWRFFETITVITH